jgi:hypothetical protein
MSIVIGIFRNEFKNELDPPPPPPLPDKDSTEESDMSPPPLPDKDSENESRVSPSHPDHEDIDQTLRKEESGIWR